MLMKTCAAHLSSALQALDGWLVRTAMLAICLASLPGLHAAETSPATNSRPATASMDALDDKQKLSNGDRLSFRIVEDKEEPKPLTISDTGELEVPYIGRLGAADKTCQSLAKEIKAELEKKYYLRATVLLGVDLFSKNRGKVYLVGQVRTSGPQDIPSDEALTLTKVILRSGEVLYTAILLGTNELPVPVVTTATGFYVVRLTGTKPASTRPLTEVGPAVRHQLQQAKREQSTAAFHARMRAGLDIRTNAAALAQIVAPDSSTPRPPALP